MNAVFQTQAQQAGNSQHNAIQVVLGQFVEAGLEVAAQGNHRKPWMAGKQLAVAPQTDRANAGSWGKGSVFFGDQGIPGIFPGGNSSGDETRWQLHGHIFQGMHGHVSLSRQQGFFELADEQALATRVIKRCGKPVCRSGQAQQLNLETGMQRLELMTDIFCLPQRKGTFPGRKDKARFVWAGVLRQNVVPHVWGIPVNLSGLVNDLSKRLSAILPEGSELLKKDLEKNFRAILEGALHRLDLVTREEFDTQVRVLDRCRKRLQALEKQVSDLSNAKKEDTP